MVDTHNITMCTIYIGNLGKGYDDCSVIYGYIRGTKATRATGLHSSSPASQSQLVHTV